MLSINDIDKISYYVHQCEINNIDVRGLRNIIKSNEYERLPKETKNKLITNKESNIVNLIKNPIIIRNNSNHEILSEKILQKLILVDIEYFMKELGSEYKIRIGNNFNYIDLLLFNIEYNCYVVIELKVTELKKDVCI